MTGSHQSPAELYRVVGFLRETEVKRRFVQENE